MLKHFLTIFLSLVLCLNLQAQVKLGIDGESASFIGIYVKDLKTGKVVASNDEYRALLPASTMKSVTAANALTSLGDDFYFETPVYLYGKFSDTDSTRWLGNLVIESCGDPTIDSDLFKDKAPLWREVVSGLHRLGIRSISGKIIISESLLDSGCIPEWEIDDVAWAYGAGLHGFNFHDNQFKLWIDSRSTSPHIPNLEVEIKIEDTSTELVRGIGSNHLTVIGRGRTKWETNASMPDPAAAYRYLLENKMKESMIAVDNEDIDDESSRLFVCAHHSPALFDVLQGMMYESHNLFAEGMLRALSPEGNRDDAITECKKNLSTLGVSTSYQKILDGSGLARADRLQPIFLSNVFEKMAVSPYADKYVALFPKAGVDGTVKGLLEKTRLKGKLALKSGSMNGVQCYAGYKLDDNGKPTHTVVILVNSFFCSRGELRGAIEKFLLSTF